MIEELIIRTLCDTLPQTAVDGLFLFGQTADNQTSAFAAVQQLLQDKRTNKVLFLGAAPMSGYPGYDNWKRELSKLGVEENMLEAVPPVPVDTDMLHTRIEAESMVLHARKKGYKKLIVTAAPFQQPRAYMAAVTAVLQHYPQLYIYSQAGKAMPWQEEVVHSQGEVQDERAGLIQGEMERIRKYNAKGDLASVEEVIDYLNRRDRGQL
jgi:hypothetical protein